MIFSFFLLKILTRFLSFSFHTQSQSPNKFSPSPTKSENTDWNYMGYYSFRVSWEYIRLVQKFCGSVRMFRHILDLQLFVYQLIPLCHCSLSSSYLSSSPEIFIFSLFSFWSWRRRLSLIHVIVKIHWQTIIVIAHDSPEKDLELKVQTLIG